MIECPDPIDYSIAVKRNRKPRNSWRWEINQARPAWVLDQGTAQPNRGHRQGWGSFRSLGDPLWDTSSSQGRPLSTLLAAIAEFERELIRERTGEGRKRAMANGVKFGRKPKLSDYQRQ
jgi:hypothetical protein